MGIFDLHVTSSIALYKMDWIRLGWFPHSNPHLVSHLIPISQLYLTMLGKSTPYFWLDVSLLPHSEVPLWKTYPHRKNQFSWQDTQERDTAGVVSAFVAMRLWPRILCPGDGEYNREKWGCHQQMDRDFSSKHGDCKVQPNMGVCDCFNNKNEDKGIQRWDFMCISWV